VRSDHGEDLAAVHLQRHLVQAGHPAEAQGDLPDVEHHVGDGRIGYGSHAHNPSPAGTAAGSMVLGCSPPNSTARLRAGIRPPGRKIIISSTTAPIHICRSGAGTWALRNSG